MQKEWLNPCTRNRRADGRSARVRKGADCDETQSGKEKEAENGSRRVPGGFPAYPFVSIIGVSSEASLVFSSGPLNNSLLRNSGIKKRKRKGNAKRKAGQFYTKRQWRWAKRNNIVQMHGSGKTKQKLGNMPQGAKGIGADSLVRHTHIVQYTSCSTVLTADEEFVTSV